MNDCPFCQIYREEIKRQGKHITKLVDSLLSVISKPRKRTVSPGYSRTPGEDLPRMKAEPKVIQIGEHKADDRIYRHDPKGCGTGCGYVEAGR